MDALSHGQVESSGPSLQASQQSGEHSRSAAARQPGHRAVSCISSLGSCWDTSRAPFPQWRFG